MFKFHNNNKETAELLCIMKCKEGNQEGVSYSGSTPSMEWEGGFFCLGDYKSESYDDKVIMSPGQFERIFDKNRNNVKSELKLLAVVKITADNGASIHRAYYGRMKKEDNEKQKRIGLSPNSIRLLALEEGENQVQISKGSKFLYFWNHPYHATRISMRIGILSIALTIISFVITLILNDNFI